MLYTTPLLAQPPRDYCCTWQQEPLLVSLDRDEECRMGCPLSCSNIYSEYEVLRSTPYDELSGHADHERRDYQLCRTPTSGFSVEHTEIVSFVGSNSQGYSTVSTTTACNDLLKPQKTAIVSNQVYLQYVASRCCSWWYCCLYVFTTHNTTTEIQQAPHTIRMSHHMDVPRLNFM